jgi:hypothetical protein
MASVNVPSAKVERTLYCFWKSLHRFELVKHFRQHIVVTNAGGVSALYSTHFKLRLSTMKKVSMREEVQGTGAFKSNENMRSS